MWLSADLSKELDGPPPYIRIHLQAVGAPAGNRAVSELAFVPPVRQTAASPPKCERSNRVLCQIFADRDEGARCGGHDSATMTKLDVRVAYGRAKVLILKRICGSICKSETFAAAPMDKAAVPDCPRVARLFVDRRPRRLIC